MRALHVLALAACLGASQPVPGQAQFGRFLAKKAEQLAATAADTASPAVTSLPGRKLYDALMEKGRVQVPGLHFDSGSARVRAESAPALGEVAAVLTEHPGIRLVIEGHTDDLGSAASNQRLSDRRAVAVRDALVRSFGTASVQLTARGLGAANPVASNETPEGRQANRRVELALNKE